MNDYDLYFARKMFSAGFDTLQIAKYLKIEEHVVYNALAKRPRRRKAA